jgi:hypothetical protein
MTDNKQMVSVPRELLKRAVKAGGAGVNAVDLVDAWRAVASLADLLAAPAEDAAIQCSEVSPQCSEHLRTQGSTVVMPERREWFNDNSERYLAEVEGWNACLDDIARLNK